MLPTRVHLRPPGRNAEPRENQFGTFACAPAWRGAYELVYGVGCDSACDVQGCAQTIPVRSNPDLAPFGTCYTDFDPNTGAPTDSWQLLATQKAVRSPSPRGPPRTAVEHALPGL